jgi:hypothetical protein
MIYTIGTQEVLNNLIKLIAVKNDVFVPNAKSLKNAYQQLILKEVQPNIPDSIKTKIEYIKDENKTKFFKNIFETDTALNDVKYHLTSGSIIERDIVYNRFKEALQILENVAPEHFALFNLYINNVFYANCSLSGGGSTSAAIGVLWIASRPNWLIQDYLEFMVHEMTHTMMFVDELCYKHYSSFEIMINPKNYATSSIVRKARPLDKVIHALVVANEVLSFRKKVTGNIVGCKLHPPDNLLIAGAMKSIGSLREMKNLSEICTPRSLELINICEKNLKELGHEYNQKLIS